MLDILDTTQIQEVARRGWIFLLAGTIIQFALLQFFHRSRSWLVVAVRTSLVQVGALMGAGLLMQKWPFPIDKQFGPVFLPLALIELFIILWYLLWPRTQKI